MQSKAQHNQLFATCACDVIIGCSVLDELATRQCTTPFKILHVIDSGIALVTRPHTVSPRWESQRDGVFGPTAFDVQNAAPEHQFHPGQDISPRKNVQATPRIAVVTCEWHAFILQCTNHPTDRPGNLVTRTPPAATTPATPAFT